ncbi:MAG: AAA family ATPase [Ignavibacteria bacterium]|nr:AAA family ATPase [Ignavibacteria bacterium]
MNLIPEHNLQLTLPQQNAYAEIIAFLSSDEPVYILKGFAGTGKTYLIHFIARFLANRKREFFLIAPTGRASRLLSVKTGYTASTIHSLIYGEAKESVEVSATGDETPALKFALKYNQHSSDTVYIIDEASMLSDAEGSGEFLSFGSGRLLKDFFKHIGILPSAKLHFPRRKVIIVGDPAQLPPVQQPQSVALDPSYLENEYNISAREFTLTDVIRQSAESVILKVATAVREYLVMKDYSFDAFDDAIACRIQNTQFLPYWKDAVADSSEEETIVLVSTNKFAAYYNNLLRSLKFKDKNAPIQKGDRLLVTSNNRLFGLLNGDIVEVIKVNPEVRTYSVEAIDGNTYTFIFRDVTVSSRDEMNEIVHTSCTVMENLLWSPAASLQAKEWAALKQAAMEMHRLIPPAKKLKKDNPELFHEQEEAFKEALKNSPYLNALQVKFGYAITCHKAQGGEWTNVFLDFRSFIAPGSEEYMRWAYTAITRARKNLFVLHLPDIPSSMRYEPFP